MAVKAKAEITISNILDGTDGKGIKSTAVTYQAGASSTIKPTGTWQTDIANAKTSPSLPYLWTKTTFTYDDDTTSEAFSVSSNLDGVQVGGRNLLKFTAYVDLRGVENRGTYHEVSVDTTNKHDGRNSLKIECNTASISGTQDVRQFAWRELAGEHGQNLMLSFWVKASVSAKMWFRYATGATNNLTSPSIDITTDWTRIVYDLGATVINPSVSYPYLIYGFSTPGTYYINSMKLEYGNVATDWTPAPEDLEERITFAETAIEQNTEQIALKASQTEVTGLGDRIATAESNITINADGIKSTVEDMTNLTKRTSTLEQSSGEIKGKVETLEGNYGELTLTDERLEGLINDNAGNITTVSITVGEVQSMVQDHDGRIATVEQTSTTISGKVEGIEKNIGALEEEIKIGHNMLLYSDYEYTWACVDYFWAREQPEVGNACVLQIMGNFEVGDLPIIITNGHGMTDTVAETMTVTNSGSEQIVITEATETEPAVTMTLRIASLYFLWPFVQNEIDVCISFWTDPERAEEDFIHTIKWTKLELGSKPTPWCPAEEELGQTIYDLKNNVAKSSAELTILDNSITATVKEVGDIKEQVNTFKITSEGFSSFIQAIDPNATPDTAGTILSDKLDAVDGMTDQIEEAKKVATNYLSFSAGTDNNSGLIVGNHALTTLKENIRIAPNVIQMRNGTTILAEYGSDTVFIGKNSSITDFYIGATNVDDPYGLWINVDRSFGSTKLQATNNDLVLSRLSTSYPYSESSLHLEEDNVQLFSSGTIMLDSHNGVYMSNGYLGIGSFAINVDSRVKFTVPQSSEAFTPYIAPGDSLSLNLDSSSGGGTPFAGYISSGGQSVRFVIPLSKPMIGVGGISITSTKGLRIRQNGKYLYSTLSAPWVIPSTYNVTFVWKNHIIVEATMPNNTNVVNNDACGVEFYGMIYFNY